MRVHGTILEVVDLPAFLTGLLDGRGEPAPPTVRPLAGAELSLLGRLVVADVPLGATRTDAAGAFAFGPAPAVPSVDTARVVVHCGAQPVFRSTRAPLAAVGCAPLELFVAVRGASVRITQAQIDARAAAAGAALGVEELSARIEAGGVRVRATRGRVTVGFGVRLVPDADPRIEELDISGSCVVSEQRIESEVRAAVRDLFEAVDADARLQLAQTIADAPPALVEAFLDEHVALTVREIACESDRAIGVSVALGLPRSLVGAPLPLPHSGVLTP